MRGVRRAFIFKMLNVKNIPSIYDFTQRYHIKAESALNKAFILLELRLLTDRIKAEYKSHKGSINKSNDINARTIKAG